MIYYGRYADNFYLLHESKEYLEYCEYCIEEYLKTLGLRLNSKSQIIPFKNGMSFMGFHFYIRNGEMDIRIDNGKKREYRRKFNKLYKKVLTGEKDLSVLEDSYRSWKNHAMYCTDHSIFEYYENKLRELRRHRNGY